jgi:hypothetical protein
MPRFGREVDRTAKAVREWLLRAFQPAVGFKTNDPIEATYLNVSADGDGKPLAGKNRYVIHFDKGGEPKVKAFWSLTIYNSKHHRVWKETATGGPRPISPFLFSSRLPAGGEIVNQTWQPPKIAPAHDQRLRGRRH